ncbi:alpha/beta fold hydrolase [Microbulbifer sp. JMSA002]|uniref:alpha/beta fold hydrolase n=1 Tax=Microbulbifer sp. JMSA002 TaxID=3243368 RepID=UPI004039DFAB
MKIILLPGLDGTGYLFKDLMKELPSTLHVEVVSYSSISSLSYYGQAQEIASLYADEDVLIVGESYSGRVAYELCSLLGERVKGLVFLASFVSRPSIYSRLASIIPTSILKPNHLTRLLLYIVGFNMSGGIQLVSPVFHSLGHTDIKKLKERLRNIAYVDKPTKKITCPVTYIKPSKDLLIASRSVQYLASLCPNFTKIEVLGGHFIAQSNPVACAKAITNAANM